MTLVLALIVTLALSLQWILSLTDFKLHVAMSWLHSDVMITYLIDVMATYLILHKSMFQKLNAY